MNTGNKNMLKKILISALIAIGLVSGSIVRADTTSRDLGQRKTEKHGRGRGFRKKGGEQERPRKTMATTKGLNPHPCRRGYTPVDGDIVGDIEDIRINRQPNGNA
jgi:hypothetical protein